MRNVCRRHSLVHRNQIAILKSGCVKAIIEMRSLRSSVVRFQRAPRLHPHVLQRSSMAAVFANCAASVLQRGRPRRCDAQQQAVQVHAELVL